MRWPWQRRVDAPSNTSLSISDPILAQYFNPAGVIDIAGISVGERSALGLSSLYRAVSVVSGTLAGLPLNTYSGQGLDRRKVPSVFDDPDPDGQTKFEWVESLVVHLMLHGKAGALKVKNEAGSLVGLPLVHPLCFAVRTPTHAEYADSSKMPAGGFWFDVTLDDGRQVTYDSDDFWYVPGPFVSGGILGYGRQSLATSIAADKSAAKTFGDGALISGLATPDDDVDITDDVPEIRRQLDQSVGGFDNAGKIAVVNRRLKFTPWTMTSQQAQFMEQRAFQIEEVARWSGVPPHLLMQTDKQTSWGTGVDEQNRGLSKFVLGHWANRIEQRGSRLLANPRWIEFEFAGLERPNFAVEVDLILKQLKEGLITLDEARELRNLPPLPEPAPAPQPPPVEPQEGDDDVPPAE